MLNIRIVYLKIIYTLHDMCSFPIQGELTSITKNNNERQRKLVKFVFSQQVSLSQLSPSPSNPLGLYKCFIRFISFAWTSLSECTTRRKDSCNQRRTPRTNVSFERSNIRRDTHDGDSFFHPSSHRRTVVQTKSISASRVSLPNTYTGVMIIAAAAPLVAKL